MNQLYQIKVDVEVADELLLTYHSHRPALAVNIFFLMNLVIYGTIYFNMISREVSSPNTQRKKCDKIKYNCYEKNCNNV